MIFDFLKKQKSLERKKDLAKMMFINMNIPEAQKSLYIQALDVLNEEGVIKIYATLTKFVNELEIKNIEDLYKNNYTEVSGMKKKEVEEKQKELNSFNFLINNL